MINGRKHVTAALGCYTYKDQPTRQDVGTLQDSFLQVTPSSLGFYTKGIAIGCTDSFLNLSPSHKFRIPINDFSSLFPKLSIQ